MRKMIIVGDETQALLRETFKCSRQMVWYALNFKKETGLTTRIQRLAMLKGGVLVGGSPAERLAEVKRLKLRRYKQEQTFEANEEDTNEDASSEDEQRLNRN